MENQTDAADANWNSTAETETESSVPEVRTEPVAPDIAGLGLDGSTSLEAGIQGRLTEAGFPSRIRSRRQRLASARRRGPAGSGGR